MHYCQYRLIHVEQHYCTYYVFHVEHALLYLMINVIPTASRPHADLLSILDILRGRLPVGAQSAVSNAAYIPPQKGLRGDPITITQLSLQLK